MPPRRDATGRFTPDHSPATAAFVALIARINEAANARRDADDDGAK